MFRTISLLVMVFNFGIQAFAVEGRKVFDHPTFEYQGVSHKIIDEDVWLDDWYDDSAKGFCHLKGFSSVYQTSAVKGWDGPYIALDRWGQKISAFPDEGNADRFFELTQIICN